MIEQQQQEQRDNNLEQGRQGDGKTTTTENWEICENEGESKLGDPHIRSNNERLITAKSFR